MKLKNVLNILILLILLSSGLCAQISLPGPLPVLQSVSILSPSDGMHLSGFDDNTFSIKGTVLCGGELDELRIEVSGNNDIRYRNLDFFRGSDTVGFEFDSTFTGLLSIGRNRIEVIARKQNDEFSDSVILYYYPLIQDSELLILCPEEFYKGFDNLYRWKQAFGTSCHVMTLESIESDRELNARDIQEKIKKTLVKAYMFHNTRYVILGGDADKFPVRYIKATDWILEDDMLYHPYYCWIPSDLYYADLYEANNAFESWDWNGNNLYGEWGGIRPSNYLDFNNFNRVNVDHCDLHPDIAVGRIPASNEAEVRRYIYKVMRYESIMMEGTPPSWVNNILLYTDSNKLDSSEWQDRLNWISQNTFQTGNFTFIPEFDPGYPPYSVNQILNSGVGFAMFYGVGYPVGSVIGYYNYDVGELNNGDRLPVVIGNASRTARFSIAVDKYMDKDGNIPQTQWFSNKPEPNAIQPANMDMSCIGERFLVESNDDGAVAFIGSQTTEYFRWAKWWYPAEDRFYSTGYALCDYFPQAWDQGIHRVGDMWNYCINNFIDNYLYENGKQDEDYFGPGGTDLDDASHMHSFILLGDPSLLIGENPYRSE